MADTEPLRRLGGGRWQSRDERFTIEPQSGTWMIVDAERTDDLGLPLVRGPYRSLAAAREAMTAARTEEQADSLLAARLASAGDRTRRRAPRRAGRSASGTGRGGAIGPRGRSGSRGAPSASTDPTAPVTPPTPREPAQRREPAWLAQLDSTARRRARELLVRLGEAGVDDREVLVRAELVDDEPALARAAIERRLVGLLGEADDRSALARAILELLAVGADDATGVAWRLVDERGRPIARPKLPKGGARG